MRCASSLRRRSSSRSGSHVTARKYIALMARVLAVALAGLAVAGCGGSSGLKGTLEWRHTPAVFNDPGGGRTVAGFVHNTTGHKLTLAARGMRLLDAKGRKVAAHIQLRAALVPPHAYTALSVTWKAGKPVRIDYG